MDEMLRTNPMELKPTKDQQRILRIMLVRSSALWNVGNYQRRQAFFEQDQGVPSYTKQYHDLKDHELYGSLGSAYSQQILRKLDKTWKSFFGSLQSEKVEHKVSLPSYFKNYKTNQTIPKLLICRNDCYRIDEHYIYISCSKDLKKKYGIKGLLKIKYNGVRKWKGEQRAMEIKYTPYVKKFHAYQTELVEPTPIETKEENLCSVDLGIKRFMSAYIKNSENINFTYESEHIFENYVKLTKKIAYYQSKAKRENDRYSTKRIRRLFLKRKRRLSHYFNNIIAHLFRKLAKYHVSKVIIGDLKGIRESVIPKHYRNKKKINTMIQNFWSYDLFKRKIENKCEEYGIELVSIDEAHTSSTCPNCQSKVKPHDRSFTCKQCGYRQDRDVVGSINILRKYLTDHQAIDDIRLENHPLVSKICVSS